MPKIVDYSKRKRKIAKAALNLFSKQGYHRVSFGDIASASGLSRTNIYNYFKTKTKFSIMRSRELLHSISRSIEGIISNRT